jgi:hypothetical protein
MCGCRWIVSCTVPRLSWAIRAEPPCRSAARRRQSGDMPTTKVNLRTCLSICSTTEACVEQTQGAGKREQVRGEQASRHRTNFQDCKGGREVCGVCVTCRTLLSIPPRHVHARLSERTSSFACYRYVHEGSANVATRLAEKQ